MNTYIVYIQYKMPLRVANRLSRVDHSETYCFECEKKFPGEKSKENHDLEVHGKKSEKQKRYTCIMCEKIFKDYRIIAKHHERCHLDLLENERLTNGLRKYLVPVESKGSIKQIMYKIEKEKHCSVCSVQFEDKKSANTHFKNVHGKKCYVCHQELRNHAQHNEHLEKHSCLTIFGCKFCNQSFLSHASAHCHIKKNHFSNLISRELDHEISTMLS